MFHLLLLVWRMVKHTVWKLSLWAIVSRSFLNFAYPSVPWRPSLNTLGQFIPYIACGNTWTSIAHNLHPWPTSHNTYKLHAELVYQFRSTKFIGSCLPSWNQDQLKAVCLAAHWAARRQLQKLPSTLAANKATHNRSSCGILLPTQPVYQHRQC